VAGRRSKSRAGGRGPAGRLRIVAGKWRGRVLRVPDLPGLRPTSERVRETLFNWLAPALPGSRCLDLCAGTGALGLEALSRGAATAVFVEKARPAAASLREACRTLDAEGAVIQVDDARRFLARPTGQAFDIVFIDPPYADDSVDQLCRLLAEHSWLAPGAFVYFEQQRGQVPPALPVGWTPVREKTAGQVRYALARVNGTSKP
jgi:16S rRNA (guanine966-N2)-methyltransferase